MSTKNTLNPQEVAHFNELSEHWWHVTGPLKTLHHINPARMAYIEQTLSLKDIKVLDVGCGGGILSEAMARQGALVTGIDADSAAIEVASKHAAMQSMEINYQTVLLESFNEGPFDVITCMELLEHVNHPEQIIADCSRLLKPGGTLFLSTINQTIKAYLGAVVASEYVLNLVPRQTHDYQKFIKPSRLASMVRAYDMSVDDLTGLNYQPWSEQTTLTDDVAINYLMRCSKSPR